MRYSTLMIAPTNADLILVPDEVMQVVNILGAKLLQGNRANLHGLIDIMREGFDVAWFATHGSDKGIHLADGPLNASEITSLTRSAGVRLTVFNTCSSYDVAYTIHQELLTDFVCTIKAIPDRMAYLTGVLFAQQLADGMDFYDAYEAAKPGQNSIYLFLPAKGQSIVGYQRPRASGDEGSGSAISDALWRLEQNVTRLNETVKGSEWSGSEGLLASSKRMEVKIDTLTAEVSALKERHSIDRRILITLIVVIVGLLIAVATLVLQNGGAG